LPQRQALRKFIVVMVKELFNEVYINFAKNNENYIETMQLS